MKHFRLFLVLFACISLTSCDVLQSVADQFTSVANLANCKFDLKSVSSVNVAGVNVKSLTNGTLTATDIVKLGAAIANKNIPLSLNLNIDVQNPTAQKAALTALDWILEVDGKQMANGVNNQAYTIAANKTTTVPLGVSTDLYSLFSSNGLEALKNFATSFSSDGTSSKVGVKIKPSVSVGDMQVPFPSYIKLEKKTGSNSSSVSTNTNKLKI